MEQGLDNMAGACDLKLCQSMLGHSHGGADTDLRQQQLMHKLRCNPLVPT